MRRIVTHGRRESPPPEPATQASPATSPTPAIPATSARGTPPISTPGTPPTGGAAESDPPPVLLGTLLPGGLAPAILGIVDRGVRRRPVSARALRAEIELTIDDGYPPVRIQFAQHRVLVEDGPGQGADARIRGALPDLIALMVSPAVGGVPLPVNARGRVALGMVVSRRVRIEGSVALVRRVLALIRV